MTKALPFTSASLARAIKGVELAGKHVIGVRADGTVLIGDNPASLVPSESETPQDDPYALAAERALAKENRKRRGEPA